MQLLRSLSKLFDIIIPFSTEEHQLNFKTSVG